MLDISRHTIMLFVKRRRILVTCSRRLENPAGLRLSPSLSVFFVSGIVEMQMRGGGPANPYIREGEPAARLPGGQGCRPPGSRATDPRDLSVIIFCVFFAEKPLPPGSRAARSRPPGSWAVGVCLCKFSYRKYIFVKNENKKI